MRELADPFRPGGSVSTGVHLLVAAACATTVVLAAGGMRAVYDYAAFATELDAFWISNGLAIGVVFALFLALLPPSRLSRTLVVALVLPVLHVVGAAAAGLMWRTIEAEVLRTKLIEPPTSLIPELSAVAVAVAVFAVATVIIPRRRTEAAHAAVMLALAFTAALGLWTPVACRLHLSTEFVEGFAAYHLILDAPARTLAFTIMPPALVALAFTALAFRHRGFLPALRRHRVGAIVLGLSIVIAFGAQVGQGKPGIALYGALVPLSLLALAVSVVSLVLLAVTTRLAAASRWRAHRDLERIRGVIAGEPGHLVTAVELTSWLRGPSEVRMPFSVITAEGELPVHGAPILASTPLVTTHRRIGELVPVLCAGDAVDVVVGRRAAEGHPLRSIEALEVRALIARAGANRGFTEVALVAWRPVVAYLAIAFIVAIPALAAIAH